MIRITLVVTDAAPLITLAAARAKGRNPPNTGIWDRHDPEVKSAVAAILRVPGQG